MNEQTMRDLETRLCRLERQNRKLRLFGAAAISCGLSVFLMGQAKPKESKELRVDSLIIEGEDRKVEIVPHGITVTIVRQGVEFRSEMTGIGGFSNRIPGKGEACLRKESGLSLIDDDQNYRLTASLADQGDPSLTLHRSIDPALEKRYISAIRRLGDMNRGKIPTTQGDVDAIDSAKADWKAAQNRAAALILGVVENVATKTGKTERCAENSICSYGPDGRVIWQVP